MQEDSFHQVLEGAEDFARINAIRENIGNGFSAR